MLEATAIGYRARDVVTASVPDRPGELLKVCDRLADAGVNVEAIHTLASTSAGTADVAIRVADPPRRRRRRAGRERGSVHAARVGCGRVADVEVRREGAVALVTLHRPEVFNAFTLSMVRELRARLAEAMADPEVGALVLTGAGKAFCAGGDVQEMDGNLHRAEAHFLDLTAAHHEVVRLLVEGPKPVVCALNGVAAGGGFGLALCGDLRVAGERARFKPAYFRLGVAPDGGSTWLLPRLVGFARAQELLFHDRVVDAQEALALGLVHEVVPQERLMERALAEADALAAGPAFALAAAKRLMVATTSSDLAQQLALERRLNSESGATPEFAEGARAFREKREPDFRRARAGAQAGASDAPTRATDRR